VLIPSAAYPYLIDRIEAVVGDEVVTRSELDRVVRSEARRRGVDDEAGLARLGKQALDALMDKKLILADARRFNLVDVPESDVDAAVQSVKSGYDSTEDFYAALAEDEMTLKELREELKDQILAVKYVDRRVRFFVRVTLDDQKKYYEEHVGSFEGRGFADVQEDIYNLLVEKRTNEKLDEYIDGLKARTNIIVRDQSGNLREAGGGSGQAGGPASMDTNGGG
ncbi:MAG TPA: SurA N-terminal domain-containing protein, partial [Nitrospirota bacterium]